MIEVVRVVVVRNGPEKVAGLSIRPNQPTAAAVGIWLWWSPSMSSPLNTFTDTVHREVDRFPDKAGDLCDFMRF